MIKLYRRQTPRKVLPSHQPLEIVDPKLFTTINIPNSERIKKVNMNIEDFHILTESGRVYTCTNGGNLRLLKSGRNLFIEDVSSYSEASLFLVRDLSNNETFLYGGGIANHDCFGSNVLECVDKKTGEKFMLIYSPPVDKFGHRPQITHIASCYPFSIIVLDYCDIRIAGQDWINSGKEMEYHVSQFICEKKIKKIKCGAFKFVVIFEDDSVMYCGNNANGQMPNAYKDNLHFCVQNETRIEEVYFVNQFSMMRFANTCRNPVNYQLFGDAEARNVKELLQHFPIFDDSNENNAKIGYSNNYFTIQYNGSFHFVDRLFLDGFTVDMSQEFDTTDGEYHSAINPSVIVFYKTSTKNVIYSKLFTHQMESKLTDCYFQFLAK